MQHFDPLPLLHELDRHSSGKVYGGRDKGDTLVSEKQISEAKKNVGSLANMTLLPCFFRADRPGA
jgi:hypothetical protein